MRWIIGDIHGMFRPLDALIAEVERKDHSPHFIFVGDYINRGPDSPRVIDRVLQLTHATFLRGNHDDVLDLILHDTCYECHEGGFDAVAAFAWFMNHGLAETLTAYGADYAELEFLVGHPHPQKLKKMVGMIPHRHRQFIHDLLPVVEHPDIYVAHAYWDPDEQDEFPDISARLLLNRQLRHQILWGRYTSEQIRQKKRWKRKGYFGHTPVLNYEPAREMEPIWGPQIVLVDTAAALVPHGRLTAVCVETDEVVQVERTGSIVK